MIIIADSGSTKTEWLCDELSVTTKGINPVRDTYEEIVSILNTELMPFLISACPDAEKNKVTEIHFYGAGCIMPFAQHVTDALGVFFDKAEVNVNSDLLGAVRALCGKEEGIACILGTGSNSCLCKNGEITENISPLGYILGDEGSGAVLGRILVSEMLKGSLKELWTPFQQAYKTDVKEIIQKVYREPQANRFLASLVPFIKINIEHPGVKKMVRNELSRFLQRNVLPYHRPDLKVNFVGGVANNFIPELRYACEANGMELGKIISRPAEEIRQYHLHVL